MVRTLTLDNMRSSVQASALKIDDEIYRLKTDLEIFAGLPSLETYYLNLSYDLDNEAKEYEQSLISFFNKQNKRNPAYIAFNICDSKNKVLLNYQKESSAIELTTVQNCQAQTKKEQIVFKKKGHSTEIPLLIISKTIDFEGEDLGTVELFFNLQPYFSMVESYQLYESGFLSVMDKRGRSLSTDQAWRIALQKNAFESWKNESDNIQFITTQNPAGDSVLSFRSQLTIIDWTIYSFVFEDEIFAPLYQQIQLAIWIILSMVITETLFLSYFTKRLITNRINSLVGATKNILSGDYAKRLSEKGEDEISELSRSFNHMTDSLQSQLLQLQREQQKLKESQHQLQGIVDNTSAVISIKDIDGKYILVNGAYCNYFDLKAENVIGKTDRELHNELLATSFRENDQLVATAKTAIHFEEKAISPRGETNTFITVKFPLLDTKGKIYATCGIATDITERIEEEKSLQALNNKLSLSNTLLESIEEGVVITDAEFNIIDLNPALENLFGYNRKELIGKKPSIFRSKVHPQSFFDELYQRLEEKGSWHGEIWETTKGGDTIPQLLTVTSMRDEDGVITHYAGIYSDITDLKQTEAKLHKLAHYDSLTGLANRLLLEERTSQAILRAQRGNHKVVMLFIDLDNFKYINDTLGHDIGDQLLKQVAQRFQHIIRDTDTLARQGGDEFVVLLSKTTRTNDAHIIAEKIKAAGSQPFKVSEHELFISTSIGVAIYPDDATNTNELLKCSDMAMYAAKESGKNNFQFYSEELNHVAVDRLKIERALRRAIENDELVLYFQPQADCQTGKIEKVETLLRWPQADGHFIPPDLFVPIAEESGLIVLLGEWVLENSLKSMQVLNKHREEPIAVSINLSARQFRHYDLASSLKSIVDKYHVDPKLVEFEVTESLLVDDYKLAEKILKEIKSFNFSIALDDFGTGYSSLSYLTLFPIDTLKLDKSFMDDLVDNRRNQAIVSASVNMGKALDMTIVCEGVETQEQFDFIKTIQGVKIQGYFFAKPQPLESLLESFNLGVS
ncbi:MAG: EAL domain-containing protein [Kangiellaceae bacterium]|nr:EAL domain-containing protein [Kangiellaceae bacterium]MCW8999311.1 EAL domain-containing protein [Kangiellaceae bacterium]MCW9016769.1 EAL domain-containing protein [Kangiellaceae bacterium]